MLATLPSLCAPQNRGSPLQAPNELRPHAKVLVTCPLLSNRLWLFFSEPLPTSKCCISLLSPARINEQVISQTRSLHRQYYFQRTYARSRHNEFYAHHYRRNHMLYNYYRSVADRTIPGFGGSFGRKYGRGRFDDRDQILAESFDYFRATNLYDANNRWHYNSSGGLASDTVKGHGQISATCLCGGTAAHRSRWSNANLPLPKGLGCMFGLSEIGLFMILRAERKTETEFVGSQRDIDQYKLEPGQKLIQVGFILEAFAPGHGWTSLQPQMSARFGGGKGNLDARPPASLTLNGQKLEWHEGSRTLRRDNPRHIGAARKRPENWIAWGGYGGVRIFENMLTFKPVVVAADAASLDFSGTTDADPLRVLLFENSINSYSGDVHRLWPPPGAPHTSNIGDTIIQSYELAFKPATFPMPKWWHPEAGTTEENSLKTRMERARSTGVDRLYSPTSDVIHTLVPSHGDYRITTSKRVVPTSAFVPHPDYGKNVHMAHSLVDYANSKNGVEPLPGATFEGQLLNYVNYPVHLRPDFPIGRKSEFFAQDIDPRAERKRGPHDPEITGDWDTGVGNAPDGAYTNRPDDGDVRGLFKGSGDPYFDNNRERRERAQVTFSPNRIISGPGMLGSLPTGVQANVPWQTLLFRPMDPRKHYGATDPARSPLDGHVLDARGAALRHQRAVFHGW